MYPELLRVGVKMSMGKRILELRMKKGMTQEEVGKIVGVQKAAVQKWENGITKNLKRDAIEKLSNFFGVTPSYLMAMTDIPNATAYTTKKVPLFGATARPAGSISRLFSFLLKNRPAQTRFESLSEAHRTYPLHRCRIAQQTTP